MRILFIQGGSRLKQDLEGNWYTDSNFNEDVWKRYVDLADSFTILLRHEHKIYSKEYAIGKFNVILNDPRIRIVPLVDFSESKLSMINPFVFYKIRKSIFEEVKKADKCFIRSGSYYTKIAYDACMKYKKPYLFEATGFAYESYSNHSIIGKITANLFEHAYKLLAKDAAMATYVTNEALQKRYPCDSGIMLGCSNVQLQGVNDNILEKRLKKIADSSEKDVITIGTAAFLDVKWKGQDLVIKALRLLKEKGFKKIRFELIGAGTGDYLRKVAKDNGVQDQVNIIGSISHEQVFQWLDELDIYIQSSYQEGLCRSVIEALSRALPVICSDTGGNYELVDEEYLFDCGDFQTLAKKIECIIPDMQNQARRNFQTASNYEKSRLDANRRAFFLDFINM